MDNGTRYVFTGQWYQEEAAVMRIFTISFFPYDNSMELFEPKTKKIFLKRIRVQNITEKDLYIGSRINVFGRQIQIIDYGNSFTKDKFAPTREKTFLLLKSDAVHHMGRILKCLERNHFVINNARMVKFNAMAVREFFTQNGDENEIEILSSLKSLESEPSVGFELINKDAIKKLYSCIHSSNTGCDIFENDQELQELRTIFQEDNIKNYIYCQNDPVIVEKQLQYFFNRKTGIETIVQLKNSVLCIIKPHAIKEEKCGAIISDIYENGFKITGLKMCLMGRGNSQEFYEVYCTVLPEYLQMVLELSSGPCIAMEITINSDEASNKDVQKEFRTFCGPMDSELAKLLRPNTLRAKYGVDKICNAVHCTDLQEDCKLELEYIFSILENQN